MMIIKPAVLFLAFVAVVTTLQNPLISSPFDNFRIECAKSSGAVRMNVRMVGSQGFIRQDIVFVIVCERVDELYPWHGIPTGIAEIEREDCYYSHLFDPVVDTESLYTCRPREYISGITRLSDTRVQVLCCRLRTRDETNCKEKEFTKPIGSDLQTEIYHRNQLINSIAVEGHNYRVRFCDLTVRTVDLIYGDLPMKTGITTETPKNWKYLDSEAENNILNTATARMKTTTKNDLFGRLTSHVTTVSSANKVVAQIFPASSLQGFEDQDMSNTNTFSMDKKDHSQKIVPSLDVQQTSEKKLPIIMDTIAKDEDQSTNWVIDETNNQNSQIPTVSFISTNEDHSTTHEKGIVSSDRDRIITTLSYFSSLRTTTSASLILLKPLNSKALYNEITTRNRTTSQSTMTTYPIEENPSKSSNQSHRHSSNGVHIDEEIKFSPFENKDNNSARNSEALGSEYSLLTSLSPFDMTTSVESGFSYKISNEIRHAPIKSPRKEVGTAYSEFKDFPNKQTNTVDREFNFPSFADENIEDVGMDYTEYDFPMKKSADGSRTYVPENHEPLNAPSAAIVYNASKKNDISGSVKRKKKAQQYGQESSQKYRNDISKELLPMNHDETNLVLTDVYTSSSVNSSSIVLSEQDDSKFSTTRFNKTNLVENRENIYDPAKFYRTSPPKRQPLLEKVLTFCTKDIAIRDRHNLVIACGSETEIWQPFRCPEGSECFFSADSSYRICCAVAEAVRYAQ
ncbi:Chaperonin GroEL [Dirofilaria immitis]